MSKEALCPRRRDWPFSPSVRFRPRSLPVRLASGGISTAADAAAAADGDGPTEALLSAHCLKGILGLGGRAE